MGTVSRKMWQNVPKNNGLPEHDVVVHGGARDAGRRVVLQLAKVAHQPTACSSRHGRASGSPTGRAGSEALELFRRLTGL